MAAPVGLPLLGRKNEPAVLFRIEIKKNGSMLKETAPGPDLGGTAYFPAPGKQFKRGGKSKTNAPHVLLPLTVGLACHAYADPQL